jgi:hypothetical protein
MAATYVPTKSQTGGFPIEAGEAIAAGEWVSVGADEKGYVADSDSGNEQVPAQGIAETDAAIGDWVEVKFQGQVHGLSGHTPGNPVYLGSDGAVATSAGHVSQVLGFALTADTMVIAIERVTVEHADHS